MLRIQRTDGAPIGGKTRALLVAWAMFLVSGFVVARTLSPDPRGFGTHQQFGLPECHIRLMFARPCPGCGMTTCFSHFVRGEFVAAARANPAGLVLAIVCVLMIPWCLFSAVRGRLWLIDEPLMVLMVSIILIGVLSVISWMMLIVRG